MGKIWYKRCPKTLLNYCEFCENWSDENHIVLKGASRFLSELCFCAVWVKFGIRYLYAMLC